MKKILLSIITLGSFGLYVLTHNGSATPANFVPPDSSNTSGSDSQVSSSGEVPSSTPLDTPPVNTKTPSPVPKPKPTGIYKDGSYVGSVADAYYGYVQVKAVISGGKLTDVVFLQYPNDRSTSREINLQAIPYLTREAISAQSANVNGVSGASQTSTAFKESLAVALAAAHV